MLCRIKYKRDLRDFLKNTIIGNAKSFIDIGSGVVIPFGSDMTIKTKNQAYVIAKDKTDAINKRYRADKYGNLASIDDTKSNGVIVNIHISEKLLDAYELKYRQIEAEEMIRRERERMGDTTGEGQGEFYSAESKKPKEPKLSPNDKIKNRLVEFAKNNGIKVEFVDSLMRNGYNINGIYNVLNKAITIANNDEAMDSLIEEISHSIEDGLGKDDPLIKRLYELTNDVDFANELGEEYVKLYGDNTEAMHKEYVGKIIKEGVKKATKQPGVIQRVINRIIEKFKSLFKKANISDLDKIKTEIDDIATELGNKVLKGNNMNFGYGSVTTIQPTHPELFSVGKKQAKKTKIIIDKYAKQVNVLNNRIKRLEDAIRQNKQSLLKYPTNEGIKNRIAVLEKELQTAKTKLGDYAKTSDPDTIIQLGNNLLEGVRAFIERFEQGKVNLSSDRAENLGYSMQVIEAFKTIPATAELAAELEIRLDKIGEKIGVQYTNELKGASEDLKTIDDLKEIGKDISSGKGAFGALVDVPDVLARTIGLAIKRAQNFISGEQKKTEDSIKKEVDLLKAAQAKRGIEEKNMYDIYIQKYKGTTVLTKKYKSEFYEEISKLFKDKNYEALNKLAFKDPNIQEWVPLNEKKYLNPNYTIIQNNKDLKRFYEFYDKTIKAYQAKLPITAQKDFIPNIRRNMLETIMSSDRSFMAKLADGFKAVTGIQTYTILDSDRIKDEELHDDLIPLKYIQKLSAEEKSNNLGEALNKFAAFAISYEEMSDVLPKIRLLQRIIKKKQYLKTADPSSAVYGEFTNLNKMINTVIDMQVKGKKKKDQGYIKMGDVKDDDGNIIGEKYKLASDIIDFGLTYNSILRIGLNPINAVTNVIVGDIGNIIEGFGGRFYRLKDLTKASNIFFKENFSDDSKMNKLLEILNPLQELEDYSHSNQLKYSKKLSGEKLKEIMYSPQRAGEKFLQTRTMIAMLLKQTIKKADGSGEISLWEAFEKDGQLKKEYKDNFKTEKEYQEFLNKLTDKVQRVNQMIHGRYSERDAAAVQQNVLWRMAFQFKKWIPAAIEQRFGAEQYDVRLDATIEGRYRTAWRLLGQALRGNIDALKAGNMSETEIYNMRKNLAELVITLGTVLMFFGLGWDDDDERKRSPYYKLAMTTLDRVSGDMLFWYDPANAARMVKTPVPLIKTGEDLLKVLYLTPFVFSEKNRYERGARKGELKLKVAVEKITPALNPFGNLISNWSEAKYQEPSNR